jgi:hypothetical protein
MIINRIYETQNLLPLYLVSFLVGLRTYQHPCMNPADGCIRSLRNVSGCLPIWKCDPSVWVNSCRRCLHLQGPAVQRYDVTLCCAFRNPVTRGPSGMAAGCNLSCALCTRTVGNWKLLGVCDVLWHNFHSVFWDSGNVAWLHSWK